MSTHTANRTRNIQLKVFVDEDEMRTIKRNMARANVKTLSDYVRQMCLHGTVINYDDFYFRSCYNELHSIGTNFNQVAKVANQTGSIYAEDIEYLKEAYGILPSVMNKIYLKIEELIETAKTAKFETMTEQIDRALSQLKRENYI